jgi:hypothetical protein
LSPILEAAIELQAFCSSQGWRFCFIGGIRELKPLIELKGTPESGERLREILRQAR